MQLLPTDYLRYLPRLGTDLIYEGIIIIVCLTFILALTDPYFKLRYRDLHFDPGASLQHAA